MPSSRNRILVPALLLLIVAAVVTGLLLGGGTDSNDTGPEQAGSEESGTAPAEGQPSPDAPVPGAPEQMPNVEEPPGAAPPQESAEAPDLARRIEGDPMAAGPADAPVSVVVYSDYSCPYCQSWSHDTQPTVETYAQRGEVRLEWRDVSIRGEESTRAATAAAAAAQQGAYWEYHEALFADMSARSEDQLVELARDLDLDVEQFTDHLTDPNVLSLVHANMQEAQALGLQSTPSFIVGGTPVVGAQPTDVFVELIEQALAE